MSFIYCVFTVFLVLFIVTTELPFGCLKDSTLALSHCPQMSLLVFVKIAASNKLLGVAFLPFKVPIWCILKW